MGFKIPEVVSSYLNNEWRKPPSNIVDTSQYYSNLPAFFINYMKNVVRPCIAFATGVADGNVNGGLGLNVGLNIKKTAVKIIKGDKWIYKGDDADCALLSEHWEKSVGFVRFYEKTIDNLLTGGTTIVKLNRDAQGRCIPCTERVDRFYIDSDDTGEIVRISILNSFLYSMNVGRSTQNYWLIEERYYKNGCPCVKNKVLMKSGIAGYENIPDVGGNGIAYKDCPREVQKLLTDRGIRINDESKLPFRDGLGVWLLQLTSQNSTVPGLSMGDPLLYGALDLLFAIDNVFSGSLTDVINGRGKILVPKRFLSGFTPNGITLPDETMSDKILRTTMAQNDDDDSFVYVATEQNKDFPPQSVQFDIRSTQYREMMDVYLRMIVSQCGFAPTSVFPFLEDRGSSVTAEQVRADDNLTRATVISIHANMEYVFGRMLDEVLYQLYNDAGQKYDRHTAIQLSDYIGNPLTRDQNVRDNYAAGLLPKKEAVQMISNLSEKETIEYLEKIETDDKAKYEAQNSAMMGYDFGGAFDGTNVPAGESD